MGFETQLEKEERLFGKGYPEQKEKLISEGFYPVSKNEFYGYLKNASGEIMAPNYEGGLYLRR